MSDDSPLLESVSEEELEVSTPALLMEKVRDTYSFHEVRGSEARFRYWRGTGTVLVLPGVVLAFNHADLPWWAWVTYVISALLVGALAAILFFVILCPAAKQNLENRKLEIQDIWDDLSQPEKDMARGQLLVEGFGDYLVLLLDYEP